MAPMSGITSLPFRLMCKKYGADVVYSEMINADAIIMENKKTKKRVEYLTQERPIGIQLMGSHIDVLKHAALKIEKELHPDILDINFGCPAYNVIKTGSGSVILNDLDYLSEIVLTLVNSVSIPVTCKMRILEDDEKTLQAAKIIEKCGAKALTVHGRTAKQKYSGEANWDIIKIIKQELKIPVYLNGDVIDEKSAQKAFSYTNCDGVMVGRASIGNPFIFKKISVYLKTGKIVEQNFEDKINDFLEFLKLCKKYGFLSISSIKTQAQYFTKGFCSGEVRKAISEVKTIDEIEAFFVNLAKDVKKI